MGLDVVEAEVFIFHLIGVVVEYCYAVFEEFALACNEVAHGVDFIGSYGDYRGDVVARTDVVLLIHFGVFVVDRRRVNHNFIGGDSTRFEEANNGFVFGVDLRVKARQVVAHLLEDNRPSDARCGHFAFGKTFHSYLAVLVDEIVDAALDVKAQYDDAYGEYYGFGNVSFFHIYVGF